MSPIGNGPLRVIGYLRVSTGEQADSGLGLDAQRACIQAEADRRGWTIVRWIEDAGVSGKSLKRPGIQEALRLLEAPRRTREVDTLVVAKLDRLSRSVADFAAIVGRSRQQHWRLVVIDQDFDASTTNGKMFANMLAVLAEWERDLIGDRTRAAMAAKKATGATFGNPKVIPPDVVERIVAAHRAGQSLRQIAADLQAAGIPTARGGRAWHASTIKAVLGSQAAADLG